MSKFIIQPTTKVDLKDLLAMAEDLWPDEDLSELHELLKSRRETAFIARADGQPAGFVTTAIRHDYVEGSDSSPVGYIEGIYVKPEFRKLGLARDLAKTAEKWAKTKGCTEMGSDAYLDNTESHAFHQAVGYKEAGKIVHFIKKI